MAKNHSDYLIIDFIDERFRIAKSGGKYATYSNELVNSKYLEKFDFYFLDKLPKAVGIGYTFDDDSLDIYICEFAVKIKRLYEENRIVIHEAYMRDTYIAVDGTVKKFSEPVCADVSRKNELLKYMYETLRQYLPNAHVINLFDKKNFLINEKHLWGLTPMHFEDDYYLEALKILQKL